MFRWINRLLNVVFPVVSPLTDEERQWLDRSFTWLRNEFGEERLRRPMVLPTAAFFPDRYLGTAADVSVLFGRVCQYMEVDRDRVTLKLYQTPAADVVAAGFDPTLNLGYALGVYQNEGDRTLIWLEQTNLGDVEAVIATLAHELGHVHLLGDHRIDSSNPEHEPLTDLLTVFMGCGIFSANRALSETNWKAGQWSGWSISKSGYLSMAQYAYALALYARARGESPPSWGRYLRQDVQAMMQMELARLSRTLSDAVDGSSDSDTIVESEFDEDELPEGPAVAVGTPAKGTVPSDVHLPVDADDHFALGTLCAAEGQHDAAIVEFSKVLELEASDAEAWLSRARSYLAIGQYAMAIKDCTEAIRRAPRDKWAYCRRAEAHLRLRQYSDAIADLERVRKLDQALELQYLLSGIAHFGLGQHERALHDLNQAIRRAPTWAENYLARGRVYDAMGKDRLSKRDFAEAIRRAPKLEDPSIRASLLSSVPL